MSILFTIQHPAHVHLFRNSIKQLVVEGHDVHTLVRKKDINVQLLEHYDIGHQVVAPEPRFPFQILLTQLQYEWEIIKRARKINPDVLVAMGEPAITHASKFCDGESLIFTDTEFATLQNKLAFPFANKIYTPECYWDNIGGKQERYPGYHELAYLHPNQFDPDTSIFEETRIEPDDNFVILRMVSWDAVHDVGDSGFDNITSVVNTLENTGARVLITSESDVPNPVADRQISVPPHRIHDLMAFANLYIGESATMATESAMLGTPAIFVSPSRRGYTDELEEKYGLVFSFSGDCRHQRGLERAKEILEDDANRKWQVRRAAMLQDKIDTAEFITQKIKQSI